MSGGAYFGAGSTAAKAYRAVALLGVLVATAPGVLAQAPGSSSVPPSDLEQRIESRLDALLERLTGAGAVDASTGVPFRVRFAGDVQGLQAGAPVRIRGLTVGTVREVSVAFDTETGALSVPVVLALVPELLVVDGAPPATPAAARAAVAAMVARGLRARLAGGAGPLGQTHVALDLVPDAGTATIDPNAELPKIPSVPSRMDELQGTLSALAARVQALPLDALVGDLQAAAVAARRAGEGLPDQIERVTTEAEATLGAVRATVGGPELRATLADLQATAQQLRDLAVRLGDDGEAAIAGLNQASVAIRDGARQAAGTVAGLDASIGARSPLWGELDRVLREAADAARSMRLLLAYLERHPDALIRGKSAPGPP